MFNLDLDNLPRAVRAMKCQALASELAKLHVAIMNSEDEPTRKALNRTANAIEKSIEIALGSPEQRALEAAQAEVEGSLKEVLLDRGGAVFLLALATKGASALLARPLQERG